MRFFVLPESGKKSEARKLFAAGICAMELSLVVSLAFPAFLDYTIWSDLFGCALLFAGTLLWDQRQRKVPALLFAGAAVLRAILALLHPQGLFSFLTYVPFSVCILAGETVILEKLDRFFRSRMEKKEGDLFSSPFAKAETVLLRSEVSLWIAVLLSYLSDLLLFPAFLLFLWVIGVRSWVSYLFYRQPRLVGALPFSERNRVRIQ